MSFKLFVLLCALSAVLAYPYEDPAALYDDNEHYDAEYFADEYLADASELSRVRRQLVGGGGGSPGKGYDISLDGRAPVWKSDNGRHQFDVTGGYSQHLGGPYGNSRPDYRAGGVYTFRF